MSYRALWQRKCRAAAAGAVLKPQGGNCAVLPKIIILYQKAQAVPCWGQPEFLYHGKSFRRFTDSAYTFPFASSLPPLFMILPEQTAIQCFPRPQAGFGLRWGAGFLSVPSCCPPVRRHHFLRARHWRWADRRRSAPVFFSLRASGSAWGQLSAAGQ